MIDRKNGMSSYKGYEYQIYITIQSALRLIFKDRLCDLIVIEPATEEDIAAELSRAENDDTSTISVVKDKRPLQVQVKLRHTGPLGVGEFSSILFRNNDDKTSRGVKPRKRPIDMLADDPGMIYTLVTTSEVNPTLKTFVVDEIGQESDACIHNVPKSIVDIPGAKNDDLLTRIGIVEKQMPKLVEHEIKQLLSETCHVPTSLHESCLKDLVDDVRSRLLGKKNKEWSKDDILERIYTYSGYDFMSKSMSTYVKPSNYNEIEDQLNENHKLVVIGTPGIGKTLTADMIAYEYSILDTPYEIIKKERGIDVIKDLLKSEGQYLFYLEDPWGNNCLSTEANTWLGELPKLFEDANEDKKFLVTSRVSILNQATKNRKNLLDNHSLMITQEHYDTESRIRMIRMKTRSLEPEIKDLLTINMNLIVNSIKVPFSIERFVALVEKTKEWNSIDFGELIENSLLESVQHTIVEEILNLGEDSIVSSIVLWLIVAMYNEITIESAKHIRKIIINKYNRHEISIHELILWMEKSRLLDKHGTKYSIHPITLSSLEEIIDKNPTKASDIIEILLTSLAESNQEELAFSIVSKLQGRQQDVPLSVEKSIVNYLINNLIKSNGGNFAQNFYRVVGIENSNHPVVVLSKCLMGNKKNNQMGLIRWQYPKWTTDEYEIIAKSKDTRKVALNFVLHILTNTHVMYSDDFLKLLKVFKWNFSNECVEILYQYLARSYMNDELIVEIALMTDQPKYDELLDLITHDLDHLNSWWETYSEKYDAAVQGEFDYEYINHLVEEPEERFSPVLTALDRVVDHRLEYEGHLWILNRRDRNLLIKPWLNALIKNAQKSASSSEMSDLMNLCDVSNELLLWEFIATSNNEAYIDVLLTAIIDTPLNNLSNCLAALCSFYNAEEIGKVLSSRVGHMTVVRRLYLINCSHQMELIKGIDYADDKRTYTEQIELFGSDIEQDIVQCMFNVDRLKAEDIKDEYIPILEDLIKSVNDLQCNAAIKMLVIAGHDMQQIAEDKYLSSSNYRIRGEMLNILGNYEFDEVKPMFIVALEDEDYRIREYALEVLDEMSCDDNNHIIKTYQDKSAPVRETCAHIIGRNKWIEGVDALLSLLGDTRNMDVFGESRNVSDGINYHVARVAADALANYEVLESKVIDTLIKFVRLGKTSSDDIVVHYKILNVLSNSVSSDVTQLFLELVNSSWYMKGMQFSGFPLRYAAVKGLAIQLLQSVDEVSMDNHSIEKLTDHTDDRLVAPALICLALLNVKDKSVLKRLFEKDVTTSDRVMLFLIVSLNVDDGYDYEAFEEQLRIKNVDTSILTFYQNHKTITEEDWFELLKSHSKSNEWIESLIKDKGIGSYISVMLNNLISKKGYKPLSDIPVATTDLAESIGKMNSYSIMQGR